MKLGRIAIDGSKLKANASKHKAMSYKRMKEQEQRLREEVRRLLQQAEEIDEAEDAEYGRDQVGDELPAELQRREERTTPHPRSQASTGGAGPSRGGGRRQGSRRAAKVKPEDKAQYSFTDPESRILKGPDGFLQGYNAQIAVELVLQLIVGQAVTQEANDKRQLLPMLRTVQAQAGQKPTAVLADNGYLSEKSLQGNRQDANRGVCGSEQAET